MVECDCIRICDGNCLCSEFGLKCTNLCWCEANCNNTTDKFDENEFGDKENNSDEDGDCYSSKDLSERKNEEDNDH